MTPKPTADTSEPIRVLIADDEVALLRALRRALAELPAELVFAKDGGEALQMLRDHHVDVLVADIDMPVLDGLALVRAARRESPTTLRILMTGSATLDRTIAAINDGEVVRFFTKPFTPSAFRDELSAVVARALKQRREGVQQARHARRAALLAWLAERFPGAERVDRQADAMIRVDRAEVAGALAAAGASALVQGLVKPTID